MKNRILFSLVMVSTLTASAQQTEFTIHDNGLIYDDQTMARLRHIVDSLNLRFKTCDPKHYRSLEQGTATVVSVKKDVRNAKLAMTNDVPFETFLQEFPHSKHRDEWIVKFRYRDYREKKIIEYKSLPLPHGDAFSIRMDDRHKNDKVNGWIFEERDGTLDAVYLSDMRARPIPSKYAHLIQYVDCLIDTTAQIYHAGKKSSQELLPSSRITAFLAFATKFDGKPQMPELDWDSPFATTQYEKFIREHELWNNKRLAWLDTKMTGHYYKSLLIAAVDEALGDRSGDAELEFYAERYLSPALALEMKRCRKPIGFCSMDQRPRIHAQSICRLAAETTQWDIFLRAHLDIMNDNFERNSDGSYAWAGRGTYLKELEELDINSTDLLIGTSLRASNVSANHYFGDIGRVGRALSESSDKEELEHRLLSMLADDQLDLFNRLMVAYLFRNYNYHLQDDVRKNDNEVRFKNALATLPDDIGKRLKAVGR